MRLPLTLLGDFIAICLALAIDPVNRDDWLLENLLVPITLPCWWSLANTMTFQVVISSIGAGAPPAEQLKAVLHDGLS